MRLLSLNILYLVLNNNKKKKSKENSILVLKLKRSRTFNQEFRQQNVHNLDRVIN